MTRSGRVPACGREPQMHHYNERDTHPADVRTLLPNVPAKKRRTKNPSRLVAPQHAALKAVKSAKVMTNIFRRPNTSEHGAHNSGPTTKPRTKMDVTGVRAAPAVMSKRCSVRTVAAHVPPSSSPGAGSGPGAAHSDLSLVIACPRDRVSCFRQPSRAYTMLAPALPPENSQHRLTADIRITRIPAKVSFQIKDRSRHHT